MNTTRTNNRSAKNRTDKQAAEPYVVLNEDNTVLTFYYDDQRKVRNGYSIVPFNGYDEPWGGHLLKIKTVLFDDTFATCTTITSTAYWFAQCIQLTTIIGLKLLNTSNVTDMQGMFMGCSALICLDVSGFATHNVTDMSQMFCDCEKLTSLDVSGFNTNNVKMMCYMFEGSGNLYGLDVSGVDTANVINMSFMFSDCSALTFLDVSGFKTGNVCDMSGMFKGCSALTILDLGNFKMGM